MRRNDYESICTFMFWLSIVALVGIVFGFFFSDLIDLFPWL